MRTESRDAPLTDGQRESLEANLRKWMGFVRLLVQNGGFYGDDADDMMGEIVLLVTRKYKYYDPSVSRFSTWLGYVCMTAISRRRAANKTAKRKSNLYTVPLSKVENVLRSQIREPMIVDLDVFGLTEFERLIAQQVLDGKPVDDLRQSHGEQKVKKAFFQIKRKAHKYFQGVA